MIKIESVVISSPEQMVNIIGGMRNPMNSWDRSDTIYSNNEIVKQIGDKDYELMLKLSKAGTDHRKFMRMMQVIIDVTAPLYWWKEFDTYKVGTVTNSCSTMHKITNKEFTLEDFSYEHLLGYEDINWGDTVPFATLEYVINALNIYRQKYIETKDKKYWWQIIQILPSSYNQKRTVSLNYEVLANMYYARKSHKLDEWRNFCKWIETLPYNELILNK